MKGFHFILSVLLWSPWWSRYNVFLHTVYYNYCAYLLYTLAVAVRFLYKCALIPSTLRTRPPLSPPVTSSELLYTLREKPWDLAYLSMFVLFWLIHCLQDLSFFFLQRACFSSSLCTVVLPFMSTLSYLSVAWLYPACCEQHCSNRHYTGISESRHNFLTINTMECCSRVECLQLF